MTSAGFLILGVHDNRTARTRSGHRPRIVLIAAALVAVVTSSWASSGFAQVARPLQNTRVVLRPLPDPVERGWIGVSVDVTVRENDRGPANLEVHVLRTVDGGPAARVGILPGDLIRAIDGELLTIDRWQSFTQNLRRGVDLRLTLDRAGRTRDVRLTTGRRPSLAPVPTGLTDHLDSVRTSVRTQLESGRGRWASRDYVALLIAGDSIEKAATRILRRVRQNTAGYGFRPRTTIDIIAPPRLAENRYSVVWNTDGALPFEYLMLQSPEADSVKTAMIHLRGALSQVTEATNNEGVHEDLEWLAVRLPEIGSAERESRRRAAGNDPAIAVSMRPVTARVAGRSFVGGAQFNDLNPQLGQYFGTDQGVLVIQVLSGTPCDEAGLVPGDVVTHVGDTEIDSVEGFRTALNQVFARHRQAELMLLRRGERVAAFLSR